MDGIRTFKCLLAGESQQVEIVDVLVRADTVYLIVENVKRRKWVLEVRSNGLKLPHPDSAKEVLGMHEVELLRFAQAREAAGQSSGG